ncbi:homoserine kinase [Candidatus Riflebacteria bacterium]
MASITSLNLGQIKLLLNNYPIDELTFLKPLKGGLANSSFYLKTVKSEYILTICEEKTIEEVEVFTSVWNFLHSNNFHCPRIIPDNDGRLSGCFAERAFFLKQFLPGQVKSNFTPKMLSSLGGHLASLHEFSVPAILPFKSPIPLTIDCSYFSKRILKNEDLLWHRTHLEKFQNQPHQDFPKAIVHADLFWDNVLFDGDELIAILDFEDVCHFYRLFDLGMSIVGTCANSGNIAFAKASCLVKAYTKIIGLSDNEKKYLKYFTEMAGFMTSLWRFLNQFRTPANPIPDHRTHKEMMFFCNKLNALSDTYFYELIFC